MKAYEDLELEVVRFAAEDIITESANDTEEEQPADTGTDTEAEGTK